VYLSLTENNSSESALVTLLVKVSQGHNYQISTNKTCMVHEVLFLQIVHASGKTTANKLSMGHRVLFLQIVHVSRQTTANKISMGHRVLFLQIAHMSMQTTANKLSMGHRVQAQTNYPHVLMVLIGH